jgi:hypothetical protein
MLKYLSLFFSVMLMLCACKGDGPGGVIIPKEKMVGLLVDMHIIDGSIYTSVSLNPDTLYKYDMDRFLILFKQHHVDSMQFRKSLRYYTQQPAELGAIYADVMTILQKKTDSLNRSMFNKPNGKRLNR